MMSKKTQKNWMRCSPTRKVSVKSPSSSTGEMSLSATVGLEASDLHTVGVNYFFFLKLVNLCLE